MTCIGLQMLPAAEALPAAESASQSGIRLVPLGQVLQLGLPATLQEGLQDCNHRSPVRPYSTASTHLAVVSSDLTSNINLS